MVNIRTSMLGKIAVAGGYLTEKQLDNCLLEQHEMQQAGASARLGEILIHKGYIDEAILQDLLGAQKSLSSGLFGEIAIRFKFATVDQVEMCLRIQEDGRRTGNDPGLLGAILVQQGIMTSAEVNQVIEAQDDHTLVCTDCGMKYNAWKMAPGQRINCAMCGTLLVFRPRTDPEVAAVVEAALTEQEPESEETSLFPEIPGYTLLSQLGTNEDSTLYEAIQDSKDRKVVIELMNGIPSSDTAFMDKLQNEAKLAVSLHHPAVKHIYSLGKHKGHPYIVTEYVESESLFNVLQREKRLPALGATQIIISIAEALEAAQRVGLTHGDIKPSMILFLKDGTVKISNLGIAKKFRRDLLTIDERARFISSYMAPELIIGKNDPTMQSDIFSLGAVYYNLISGVVPFEGTTPKEIIISISSGLKNDLRNIGEIPHDVMDLIEMMLTTDPRRRIQNYEILLMRLSNIKSKLVGVPPVVPQRRTETGKETSATGSLRAPRRSTTRTITGKHRRPGTGKHRVGTGTHRRPGTGTHRRPGTGEYERTQAIMDTMELIEKKDKTSAGVILIRLFTLLVIVAGAYFGYSKFKEPVDPFKVVERRKARKEKKRREAEAEMLAAQKRQEELKAAQEAANKTEIKKADSKKLESLLAEASADINNIPRVTAELNKIQEGFPDDPAVADAISQIEDKRKRAAANMFPSTFSVVEDAIKNGTYIKAKQKADMFMDMFFGLEEAKKIDALRLRIPEIEAEKYFESKEQIDSFASDKKYKEAIAMLDTIIQNFSSEKWLTEAKARKADFQAKLKHEENTAGMRRGRSRMKHYAVVHKGFLEKLGVFNTDAAGEMLKTFKEHEDGKNLPKLVAGMELELGLIKSLRTRVAVNINKGFISKYLKTPGSAEALPIQSADEKGIKVGPVFLSWDTVALKTRTEIVLESCNYNNKQQVAELAVYYSAVNDKGLAMKWLQNSTAKGFESESLTPLFHTSLDIEAEAVLTEAVTSFENKLWMAAKGAYIKLISDYPDTIPVMRIGYETIEANIKEIDKLMREDVQPETVQPAEGEKLEEAVSKTGLRQDLLLEFNDESDLRYIFPESGFWKIRNLALNGSMKRGDNTISARFKCEKPFQVKGKLMFEELNAAIHVTVGEVKFMLDITSGILYTIDADKTRKQMPFKASAKQWYDFNITINKMERKVTFQFGQMQAEGKCGIFSDDVILFIDQKNSVYFDSLLIKADFISKNEMIP